MNYLDIMIGRQEYEERMRWLRSLYTGGNQHGRPGMVGRLVNHLLYVVGKGLISLGRRMQHASPDAPTAAAVTK